MPAATATIYHVVLDLAATGLVPFIKMRCKRLNLLVIMTKKARAEARAQTERENK